MASHNRIHRYFHLEIGKHVSNGDQSDPRFGKRAAPKRSRRKKMPSTVQRAVYTDVKTSMEALQSAVQALISSQATFAMSMAPKTSITPGTVGSTVLSLTTTSDNLASGDYEFSGYTGNTAYSIGPVPKAGLRLPLPVQIWPGQKRQFLAGWGGPRQRWLTFLRPAPR